MAGAHDQRIGPYRLVRRLGRGGFADVWLAERSGAGRFRRQVALKLVVAGDAEGDSLRAESLLREARLVSWLDDPAIVAVEAADTEDDIVWMAMEYCDGGSLTALLRRLAHHGLPMPPARWRYASDATSPRPSRPPTTLRRPTARTSASCTGT